MQGFCGLPTESRGKATGELNSLSEEDMVKSYAILEIFDTGLSLLLEIRHYTTV